MTVYGKLRSIASQIWDPSLTSLRQWQVAAREAAATIDLASVSIIPAKSGNDWFRWLLGVPH